MKRSESSNSVALQVFDPRRGEPSFKIDLLGDNTLRRAHRFNYFTVIFVQEGSGGFHLDLNEHRFAAPVLLFVSPYQTVFLTGDSSIKGESVQFHANFFCIEAYHEEVGCNGVLFNDIYGQPMLRLAQSHSSEYQSLFHRMKEEVVGAGLARSEILLSYLKVFLIKASRAKMEQQNLRVASAPSSAPPIVERLIPLIELNYSTKHRPADYSKLLNITPKALGRLVKEHFGKTMTELIRERVLKHAKWQLLHTQKPVKEIAAEAGFADELYFSRLFKRGAGLAPTAFREFEKAIRGSGNPSI